MSDDIPLTAKWLQDEYGAESTYIWDARLNGGEAPGCYGWTVSVTFTKENPGLFLRSPVGNYSGHPPATCSDFLHLCRILQIPLTPKERR